MHLSKLDIENYRKFGSKSSGGNISIVLHPGVNLFVGPNDAGKTCIIDAVRLLVGSVTGDFVPVTEDDFHIESGTRASEIDIVGEFRGLDSDEAAALLEYLSYEEVGGAQQYFLRVRFRAVLQNIDGASLRKRRVKTELKAGSDDEGVRFEGQAREMLLATYLKPLRDAVYELSSRRGSRLSQILRCYEHIVGHDQSDWDEKDPTKDPKTLMGISKKTDYLIRNTNVITKAEEDINDRHLSQFSIGDTSIKGSIKPTGQELRHILERLELSLSDSEANTYRGLGVYNLLFMATELLSLSMLDEAASATSTVDPDFPLLLIEEPEAHLHPQYQQRLIEYIKSRSKNTKIDGRHKIQVLMSSHSSHFAAHVPLENMILLHKGTAFPLNNHHTKLDDSDYEFLERFLDVTKANLFFASGVIIVEGDAEAILLPVLARLLGRPLDKYGISIVNVGHVGLFRYSKIFQRKTGPAIPVKVACIADRDIPPQEATSLLSESSRKTENQFSVPEIEAHIADLKRIDGQNVTTFVSPCWTLEYDLAQGQLHELVHIAVRLAVVSKNRKTFPAGAKYDECVIEAKSQLATWKQEGKSQTEIAVLIYEPLFKKRASKAETAQALAKLLQEAKSTFDWNAVIPSYLVDALKYASGAS